MTFPRPGYELTAGLERPVWTPAGFVARGDRYVLTCDRGHTRDAPLQTLIDAGQGDILMRCFKWKCAECGSKTITIDVVRA